MSGRLIFSPLGSVIMGGVEVGIGGNGIWGSGLSGEDGCKVG